MASRRVATIAGESREDGHQHDGQQDQPDQDDQGNLAAWMAKVDGSPVAVALGNQHIGIVRIVVDNARTPVPVVTAIYRASVLAVS